MLKRIVCILVALGGLSALAGCNTMEGAGKDIERAGQGIHDSAERNK